MNVNMTTSALSVELDKRIGQPADIAGPSGVRQFLVEQPQGRKEVG